MIALCAVLAMTSQDTSRWSAVGRYLEESAQHGAFPGAAVAIGRHDTVLYLHAVGHMTHDKNAAPMTTATVFDVASLTKVIGLTTEIMMLVQAHRVDLDAPAHRYVPAFHDTTITVRQLLTHSSGLPAWKPLYQQVRPSAARPPKAGEIDKLRARMFALVNAEPLETPPGTRMVYSDLGAMVLTQVAEHVTGERIDRWQADHIFGPLGMRDTRYRPPASWLPRIAPTEVDTAWRGRLVHGEVHDENAASMGGISGHAGLFSTAGDMAKFAEYLLTQLEGAGRRDSGTGGRTRPGRAISLPDSATVAMFTAVEDSAFSNRALGWEVPNGQNSSGSKLSRRAFGHTGFTGTSIWIDPGQDLFVILLTNRVNPTRENTQIFEVRRRVADMAVELAGAH